MSKKMLSLLSLLIIASMLMAAFPVSAADDGEIRIGIISAFTGVFASFGNMQRTGYEMALEEVNYQVAGKTIKVIEEDDQLNNEMAITKTKKLLEQDKIHVLTGMVSGDEGLAVGNFMKDKEIPVVVMYSASEDMTMRQAAPNVIRPTWTGAQPMDVFGCFVAKELGYKRIYHIGEDYSYPYNQLGGFKRGFCRCGGQEVKTVWHPSGGVDDFSSVVAAIPTDEGYDAVLYNGAGSDALGFVTAYVELGMMDVLPLIGQSNTFEQSDLPNMPMEVEGLYSGHLYAESLQTPEMTEWRARYEEKYNRIPAAAAEFAYSSMKLIIRALEATNGDTDPAKLIAAMKEVDLTDDPRGPITLDQYNAAVQNVYIRQVKVDDQGRLYNQGLYTVANVSQFGPYNPDVYLAQPPDTGDYPGDMCSDMPAEMLTVEKDYEFIPW
jgi:branched-chain amino acid transport system substrate-binding protein